MQKEGLSLSPNQKKSMGDYFANARNLDHIVGILGLITVRTVLVYGITKNYTNMTYQGKIFFMEGKIHIKKKADLLTWLSQFPDESTFDFVVTPLGVSNNTNQSKLYHKWCDIMYKDFGWDSKSELHDFFKKTFNNGESTKNFDTKDWSEFMIKVQAFAHENNIILPTGELE